VATHQMSPIRLPDKMSPSPSPAESTLDKVATRKSLKLKIKTHEAQRKKKRVKEDALRQLAAKVRANATAPAAQPEKADKSDKTPAAEKGEKTAAEKAAEKKEEDELLMQQADLISLRLEGKISDDEYTKKLNALTKKVVSCAGPLMLDDDEVFKGKAVVDIGR